MLNKQKVFETRLNCLSSARQAKEEGINKRKSEDLEKG
jgi:hypothetical protein